MTDATDTKRPLLVFLNEVAGGRGLLKAVRERTEAGGISEVIVAAPQNQPTIGSLIDRGEPDRSRLVTARRPGRPRSRRT